MADLIELKNRRFRRVLQDLFACADDLKAQMAETRKHCKQVEEVMRAIRENRMTAKNYVLPKFSNSRDRAANDG